MKYNWKKVPSVPYFINILKKRITFDSDELSNMFFESLEDFFYYGTLLGYIKDNNFKNILIRLTKIKRVGNFTNELNDRKSISMSDNSGIYMRKDLSRDEMQFFMLKEIIRNASSISSKNTKSITSAYLINKGVYGEERVLEDQYLENGFRLIEDGINYDMAENIYYASKKKKRPIRTNRSEKKVFGNMKFLSNFRYHPSFQELTTVVGRKILKNNNLLSDDEVLANLGRISLNDNFSINLFLSLKTLYRDNVYDILGKLGIIYKKETDAYKENLIKNRYLMVIHARKAYKGIMSNSTQERIISRAS